MKEAALKYAEKGWSVFPVVVNKKNPLTSNGYKDASLDPSVINQWWDKWPDANIGIPTGSITGTLVVDVDIKDGKDGNISLQELESKCTKLPETRRHNTPSGGYHLLFNIGSMVIPCSAGKLGEALDIRADGGYIVVPPSVIEGIKYKIVNPEVVIADAPEWLISLALESKKSSSAGSSVTEGNRNEHIFKAALNCKRNNIPYEDAVKVVTDENDMCTPPLDDREIQRTLNSAYRYEASTVPQEIVGLNKKHAVVMVGGKCRVLNEIQCPIFNRPDISLSTPTDFMNRYANRKVNDKPLGQAWFNHPKRRQLEGIVFAPGKDTPGQYNLWRGFAVDPKEGDCSLYLKHIKDIISSGDINIYNYIIGWMAHSVQNMDNLVGTAIVLKGKQGAGKGIYVREFGRLFGGHFTHISQSSHLTGKFNAHLKQTIVLFADEACWGGDKQAEGPLKALITEPTLLIEGKGQDPITVKNHVHVLVSSNNDWVVPCGPEERRFLVVEVSDKRAQDGEYFGAIQKQMDNGGREALLHYLMNYDLKGVDLRSFPKTEALFEMKMLGASPVHKFWFEKLMAGALDCELDDWNKGVILASKLQDDYGKFAGNAGVRHKGTDTELGTQLKKLVPAGHEIKERHMIGGKRYPVYKFPSLIECRIHFETLMNQKINWPVESVVLRDKDDN